MVHVGARVLTFAKPMPKNYHSTMILQYTQGMYYERSIRSEAHHLVNLNAFSCQKRPMKFTVKKVNWTAGPNIPKPNANLKHLDSCFARTLFRHRPDPKPSPWKASSTAVRHIEMKVGQNWCITL